MANNFIPEYSNGFQEIICPRPKVINEFITIYTPTLEEIHMFGETYYAYILWLFTRRPYDIAVELYDKGIDYQEQTEFSLFYSIANTIPIELSCILFGRLDFREYEQYIDRDNGMPVLFNPQNGSRIDEVVYNKILSYLRYVNFLPTKVEYDVGNGMAKKFLIDRMRRKQKKREKDFQTGKEKPVSKLYTMTSYLVNHRDFKYDYSSIMKLYVCQVYESFYRILNGYQISNMNYGIYTGSIDGTKLKQELDILKDLHA